MTCKGKGDQKGLHRENDARVVTGSFGMPLSFHFVVHVPAHYTRKRRVFCLIFTQPCSIWHLLQTPKEPFNNYSKKAGAGQQTINLLLKNPATQHVKEKQIFLRPTQGLVYVTPFIVSGPFIFREQQR